MALVLTDDLGDGVRLITLDDPDRRNAMSPALLGELAAAADAVAADRDARVVIVTGNGPAFSAGADLPALFGSASADDRDVAEIRAGLREVYDSFLRVRRLEFPTIAAVNGAAIGAGVNLAMACDVRFAAPSARFGVTFTRLGLHPGGGTTFFVTQALGRQRALSLILDGETLDADEALRLGLVLEVVDDPLVRARETAARWAAIDPWLARDIKRAVGIAERGHFDETVDFESWAQAASTRSPLLAQAIERYRR